eukprot:TRINITY_DN1967_c0_g1_i1.p1 TRINITY_DN1967_c0_g1~~TRINITY_DN1967_c0_g1_i1.p1  ORF type:complete len:569 (-),score=118.76 TRINITY_DN1967_c0_g1_i1:120-1826(-)
MPSTLVVSPQSLVFVSNDSKVPNFSINRSTCAIVTNDTTASVTGGRSINFEALFGIISLPIGDHVILITKIKMAALLADQPVYQIIDTEVIPVRESLAPSQSRKSADKYVRLLKQQLKTPSMFFSKGYDLTNSAQAAQKVDPNSPINLRVQHEFMWNYHASRKLLDSQELHPWVVPVICGFLVSKDVTINSTRFNYTIISRRSRLRPGTRFFVRGIDMDGNVANFVETEQIVTKGNSTSSFLQIRGSIPLFWAQTPNIKYKPKIVIEQTPITDTAFEKHAKKVQDKYGRVALINLVDNKGSEQQLAQTFEQKNAKYSSMKMRYIHFDFHKKCSGMKYHTLIELLKSVEGEILEYGFFSKLEGKTQSEQAGVFRTNCVDCLDRTNVVQSLLARYVLNQQLQEFSIIGEHETFDRFPTFEATFKGIWADNADAISTQYSGTPALKTDFTRTGRRTYRGAIDDGINSLKRYVLNNFYDGERQDSYDLIHGNFYPQHGKDPFTTLTAIRLLIIALMVFILFTVITTFPPSTDATEFALFFVSFVVTAFVLFKVAVSSSKVLVDLPALNPKYR